VSSTARRSAAGVAGFFNDEKLRRVAAAQPLVERAIELVADLKRERLERRPELEDSGAGEKNVSAVQPATQRTRAPARQNQDSARRRLWRGSKITTNRQDRAWRKRRLHQGQDARAQALVQVSKRDADSVATFARRRVSLGHPLLPHEILGLPPCLIFALSPACCVRRCARPWSPDQFLPCHGTARGRRCAATARWRAYLIASAARAKRLLAIAIS